ncbi:hypothetical protein BDD12DRAFT_808458 [Trichophaea hybrida]|nr:hypothetical protein BDD12DRAFT_808458 [Trichophaea hybrida]
MATPSPMENDEVRAFKKQLEGRWEEYYQKAGDHTRSGLGITKQKASLYIRHIIHDILSGCRSSALAIQMCSHQGKEHVLELERLRRRQTSIISYTAATVTMYGVRFQIRRKQQAVLDGTSEIIIKEYPPIRRRNEFSYNKSFDVGYLVLEDQ